MDPLPSLRSPGMTLLVRFVSFPAGAKRRGRESIARKPQGPVVDLDQAAPVLGLYEPASHDPPGGTKKHTMARVVGSSHM